MTDSSHREKAVERATVSATALQCFDVAADLEAYPDWAQGVTSVSVIAADEQGRATRAAFEVRAIGRSARYELQYDYSQAPRIMSWSLVEGDIMTVLEGSYSFGESDDLPGGTDISYELAIDLVVPLPGFVKRRAEGKILEAALPDFCQRIEDVASTG